MVFFFQAEDGIRDLVRSRGLGDVYKRQAQNESTPSAIHFAIPTPPAIERIAVLAPSTAPALAIMPLVSALAAHAGRSPVSYTHLTLPTIYSV